MEKYKTQVKFLFREWDRLSGRNPINMQVIHPFAVAFLNYIYEKHFDDILLTCLVLNFRQFIMRLILKEPEHETALLLITKMTETLRIDEFLITKLCEISKAFEPFWKKFDELFSHIKDKKGHRLPNPDIWLSHCDVYHLLWKHHKRLLISDKIDEDLRLRCEEYGYYVFLVCCPRMVKKCKEFREKNPGIGYMFLLYELEVETGYVHPAVRELRSVCALRAQTLLKRSAPIVSGTPCPQPAQNLLVAKPNKSKKVEEIDESK
jgi:hypothetical protein